MLNLNIIYRKRSFKDGLFLSETRETLFLGTLYRRIKFNMKQNNMFFA